MNLFSNNPMLLPALLLLGAFVLIVLSIYVIRLSVRADQGRYVFLSSLSALRRKFSVRREVNGQPWALVYVGLSLHRLRNLHSQTEAGSVYERVRQILLMEAAQHPGELLSNCDGKNFALLTRRNEEEFSQLAEHFFSDLEHYAAIQGIVHLPEVHFGYYAAKSHEVNFDEALSRSKQAYKHAETARESLCIWDFELLRSEEEVEKLEREISSAIDRDEFFLEFQPFVDARTEAVIGGEVLTRLNLPDRSLVQPARFLRAIAGIGLYSKFDYYVFGKCCGWAACQLEEHRDIRHLSCNFSRYTVSLPDFSQTILRIADQYGVPHGILDIEVTEEEQETESAQVSRNLELLHQAGFSIFLDDFGCGFTSFGDLQHYPIDVVKVDKSLLDRAVTEKGLIIFRHVVALARDLGCTVLCEGVETREQLELVRESGCDIIQGYYYYKALPAETFKSLLHQSGDGIESSGAGD